MTESGFVANSVRPSHSPGVRGAVTVPYERMVEMTNEIKQHDQTFAFAILRPVCDELWNLMDGQRTLKEIRDIVCFEFDVEIPQHCINDLVAQMVESGRVVLMNG